MKLYNIICDVACLLAVAVIAVAMLPVAAVLAFLEAVLPEGKPREPERYFKM